MKKHLSIIVLAFCIYTAGAQEPATAFEMNERLGRGMNMGNAFEAPTESEWGNPWKPEYFRIMAEMGFSHVRIPIRWTTIARSMSNPPYTVYPSFLNRIQQVVDTALKYNLHPIINMHHHEALFEDPDGQKDRFLAQWTQIAEFFKDYPDSLLFEVLNEPHNNLTPAKWNDFFAEALGAIRLTNPSRVVLMGIAEYGGLAGVPHIILPDDPYVILSVHYYNPFNFTHQGASWVGENANAWLGTKWYDTDAERQTMMSEFAYLKQFAQEKNVPVHVGEFGAYSTADIESRVRWTTFLSRWFEEQGFSWAYWEFSAGFGIYNPASGQILIPLANALLHNSIPEPTAVIATPIFQQDFQNGISGWNLNTSGGAQANMTSGQGYLNVNITNGGTQAWNVQLIKPNIALEKGAMYRVTAKGLTAQGLRQTTSYLGKSSDPWNAYSGYNVITFTSQLEEHGYTFIMMDESVTNARLVFDLGLSSSGISLSYVAIEKLTMATSGYHQELENIKYYPNPVKDTLRFENLKGYNYITVFDMQGRQYPVKPVFGDNTEIDLQGLPPGIYLISIGNQNERSNFKIIKK